VGRPVVAPAVSGATSPTDALRRECGGLWESLHEQPFLREIAAGTLPLPRFRLFLEQDLHFLPASVRALGLGLARANDDEQMRLLVEEAAVIVEREIESERDLLRRVEELTGPADGAERTPTPATVAYTGWLLASAARGDALDVLVALLPCAWSYAEIALALEGEVADHPIYADWVRLFATPEYVDAVAARRASLDELVRRVSDRRLSKLSELFTTATRLELLFWDMAYRGAHWPDLRR
jgi:thiaminase/transcriptional activator TenA